MTRHLVVDGHDIVPISADIDRASFTCGNEPALDRWIQETARQTAEERLNATYVLVESGARVCRAYYTLRPVVIQLAQIPRATRRWKRGDAPALLLAKMAVVSALQNKGFGSKLLADAMLVALQWSMIAGGAALLVDAKNDGAHRLYERAGFTLVEGPRLYLPLWQVETWARQAKLL